MKKWADKIDHCLKKTCEFFLWANLLLVFLIVLQVVGRYLFNWTSTIVEELQWYLYSIAMMTGIAYAVTTNSHVRADILYSRFSKKWQHIIELVSILLFVLPFFCFVFYHSLSFVERSFAVNEASANPGGLPWRWLIKGVIPVSCLLIISASFSRLLRTISSLKESNNVS